MIDSYSIALVKDIPGYSGQAPYHPSEMYPEFESMPVSKIDNPAFRAVRNSLCLLGLDKENFGKRSWNPFKTLIREGGKVVLKPNLVTHINAGVREGNTDTDCLVTHGSVIRVVLDYVAKAMGYRGSILMTDCPIQGSDWNKILELIEFTILKKYVSTVYPEIRFYAKDYRLTRADKRNSRIIRNNIINNDIAFYSEIDLGENSLLLPLMNRNTRFGVTGYKENRMEKAHTSKHNIYLIPDEILNADLLINLPKLKTHRKAGITCALKNLVGINGHKDYLPHFRFGNPDTGGDEYPETGFLWNFMWLLAHKSWEYERGVFKQIYHLLFRIQARFLRLLSGNRDVTELGGGSWFGNDTLWRMILDINRCFFYYDRKDRKLGGKPWRLKCFSIADGLIAGEKEGPLSPSPYRAGYVLAGLNPAALDAVASTVMGFDYKKVKYINNAFYIEKFPLTCFLPIDIKIKSNVGINSIEQIYREKKYENFTPSRGFQGKLEFDNPTEHAGLKSNDKLNS